MHTLLKSGMLHLALTQTYTLKNELCLSGSLLSYIHLKVVLILKLELCIFWMGCLLSMSIVVSVRVLEC